MISVSSLTPSTFCANATYFLKTWVDQHQEKKPWSTKDPQVWMFIILESMQSLNLNVASQAALALRSHGLRYLSRFQDENHSMEVAHYRKVAADLSLVTQFVFDECKWGTNPYVYEMRCYNIHLFRQTLLQEPVRH
jgi:hypothetical protein